MGSSVLLLAALLLLASLALGMVRALRGPSLYDRMLAVLLAGSGGVALVLVLARVLASDALIDVALVLALLAAVAAIALTRREGGGG